MIRITFVAAALALLAITTSGFAQKECDAPPKNQVEGITRMIEMFGLLGIQLSGTIKENDGVWCVFNDWHKRDDENRGRFDNFSICTTFGGTWY